ncbi:MAG: metallophosphoesterase [Verrucomicrobiota bacterium]
MNRRHFLQTLGLSGALLSLNQCSPSQTRRPWRMLFLTDFHAREDLEAPVALHLLAERVNQLAPDFVLGGGDCIHGGFAGEPEVCRERFGIFKDFIQKIKAPAHWMIGNHDFVAAVDVKGNPRSNDPTRMYREFTGNHELHRHIELAGRSLICLQSVQVVGGEQGYRGFVDEIQLEWLRKTLAGIPEDRPILLFSHIPLQTTFMQSLYGSMSALPSNLVVENAKAVLDMFSDRPLQFVLQGHLHINERVIWNDTTFVMAGAVCGAWWKGGNRGTREGFGQLDFHHKDTVHYRYGDYGWSAPSR